MSQTEQIMLYAHQHQVMDYQSIHQRVYMLETVLHHIQVVHVEDMYITNVEVQNGVEVAANAVMIAHAIIYTIVIIHVMDVIVIITQQPQRQKVANVVPIGHVKVDMDIHMLVMVAVVYIVVAVEM